MLRSLILACVAYFASTAAATTANGATAAPNNLDTSLRILYQNNLNATDDVNHVPFLLLDNPHALTAAKVCQTYNEKPMPDTLLRAHKSDFERLFAYLVYADYTSRQFIVESGILNVEGSSGRYFVLPFGSLDRFARFPVICTQSQGSAVASSSNEITVSSHGIQYTGFRNQKAFNFQAVPFADKPVRFAYPKPYSGPHNVQATTYPAQCAQPYSGGSEDCLYLNVFSSYLPKAGSKSDLKPVVFWIHGGGFTGGNGQTDGSNLASREDVVFVSIQYRLSTLGFLAVPGTDVKGNYGIADQVAALKWVRENIAAFGGDPNKITIQGESAGAGSVRVLLGSPPAIGNFRGAIAMSNLGGGVTLGLNGDYSTTYSSYKTIQDAYDTSKALFAEAGCNQTTVAAQLACLKTVPALTLVGLPDVARYVVQDGTYVNTEQLIVGQKTASTAHVPVMFGIMADDGASFVNYPKAPVKDELSGLQSINYISAQYAQSVISSGLFPFPNTGNLTLDTFNVSARLYTDAGFRCVDQSTVYAGTRSGAFPSAYFYQFDRSIGGYDPNNVGNPPATASHPLGDPSLPYFKVHAGDVEFAFASISPSQTREPQDLWFAQLVSGYWSEFARSLQPNPPTDYLIARGYGQTLKAVQASGPWWPVGGEHGPIQRLNWPPRVDGFLELEQCKFLNYSINYYVDENRG